MCLTKSSNWKEALLTGCTVISQQKSEIHTAIIRLLQIAHHITERGVISDIACPLDDNIIQPDIEKVSKMI